MPFVCANFDLMKTVGFIVPDGNVKMGSLFGAIEILDQANSHALNNGGAAQYAISVIGLDIPQHFSGFNTRIDLVDNFIACRRLDLIVIPGVYDPERYIAGWDEDLLQWLVRQYKEGVEIASLCTGAFLVAAAGLLSGSECSTHWKAANEFIRAFPDVRLRIDKVITDNRGIYTAGGGNSSLNLILYLVEKFSGRAAALYASKVLGIDIDRSSQSQFILFEGQMDHDDEDIRDVQLYIEKNVAEKLSVEALADMFRISRRTFVRRFKKATNHSPIGYIQKMKVELAKRQLENGRKSVNEVMYAVGYSDIKGFRNVFKKNTGLSPLEYKQKFSVYK